MKKTYKKPNIEITEFDLENIITASGIGLTNGGENGSSIKESFNSLFG